MVVVAAAVAVDAVVFDISPEGMFDISPGGKYTRWRSFFSISFPLCMSNTTLNHDWCSDRFDRLFTMTVCIVAHHNRGGVWCGSTVFC